MDMKTCKRCNQEKPLDEFSINKTNKDGSTTPKPNCRPCEAIISRERYIERNRLKSGGKAPDKKPDHKKDNTKLVETIHYNSLSNAEISGIRELLKYKETILHNTKLVETIDNNRSIVETIDDNSLRNQIKTFDKTERNARTYNIHIELIDRLDSYCKDSLLKQSDIVNIALNQFLSRCNDEQ